MAQQHNKYSIAAPDGGKVRIITNTLWEPLTILRSSDGGNTFTDVTATAESYTNTDGTKTYRVPASHSDIVKVVRGGAALNSMKKVHYDESSGLEVSETNGIVFDGTIYFDTLADAVLKFNPMTNVQCSFDGGETWADARTDQYGYIITSDMRDGMMFKYVEIAV